MGKAKKIRNLLLKEQARKALEDTMICEATSSQYYKRTASGKLIAIITPGDPPIPPHVGANGEICCCDLLKDHLGEPGVGIVRDCFVKPQDNV